MEWKLPLTDIDIGQEEIDAVTAVLKSKWLTMGSVTEEFEKKFAQKMSVKYTFAVNNGTAALHLANLALNISPGDEVICPVLTFVASANASRYCGAKVVLADIISEEDWTVDPQDIESKITSKTKAITVVHYGGFPCKMEEILRIAKDHHLSIIEDCAHIPFGYVQFRSGQRQFVGSIGDIGCFSFFGNKNMTMGEGGLVSTNSDEYAAKIKLLRSHGMTTLTYDRHKGHAHSYDVVGLGYNYRTDELHSAIALCQLQKIDKLNEKRRQVYRWYLEYLRNNSNVIVPFRNRNLDEATCHIIPVMIKQNCELIRQKFLEARIQTSKHYTLINHFSIYRDESFKSKVPWIEDILTLPLSPLMTKDQVKWVCSFLD